MAKDQLLFLDTYRFSRTAKMTCGSCGNREDENEFDPIDFMAVKLGASTFKEISLEAGKEVSKALNERNKLKISYLDSLRNGFSHNGGESSVYLIGEDILDPMVVPSKWRGVYQVNSQT